MGDRALALVAAVVLAACSVWAGTPPGFDPLPGPPPDGRPHVELHYLGSGGWLFRRGADALAAAPFVSHPTWLELLRRAEPDRALIDAVVPLMPDVEIVLVGHGHYDHAMDLPYLATARAPAARFYGGKTVVNVLAAAIDGPRLQAVDDRAAVADRPGQWFHNRAATIRFMPLRSTHAPHLAGIKLAATGTVEERQSALPARPLSWREGEPLAFLVDFLTDGRVAFRIYYQDTASEPGTGVLPVLEGADAAPVDVAILCVGAFDQVPGNPEHILTNVRPRHVVGGHWEDFLFRKYQDPLRPVPGTDVAAFLRRARAVTSAPIHLPAPQARLYFPVVR